PLQTLEIHNSLRTTFVGRTIYLFTSLESTNQTALKIAQISGVPIGESRYGPAASDLPANRQVPPHPSPALAKPDIGLSPVPEGTLVLADAQTQGRGRLGRRWISPPGVNLYASLILRPNIPIRDTPAVTCLAAVSVVQAVRACTHLGAVIKWPNDVLIHEKKAAGILTELGIVQNQVNYIVIGIGINVNSDIEMFPTEVRTIATSLKTESGQPVNRNKLMAEICNKLEENYARLLDEGTTSIIAQFRSFTTTLGKRVKVITPGKTIEGWAEDVDPHGALILRMEGQTHERVHSGDVIHIRNSQ
ncbi:MAG: biotin--[acetyl-CoA-carboxylase] ligase, partial [Nitrospira sp.]|nr:biotin--[acetyl-CoA-carboxylase] ligase [Nitrospira sp.]